VAAAMAAVVAAVIAVLAFPALRPVTGRRSTSEVPTPGR
jgi:hypothetical protein